MANDVSKNKLKVVNIIATYFPVWGGAQRQLAQISGYLKNECADFFILTRRLPGTCAYEVVDGVEIYRMPVTNRSRIIDSICFIFFSLSWLIRNNSKFNILYCCQAYSPTTIGVLVKKILRNKRVITLITSSNEYGEVKEIKRLLFKRLRVALLKCVDKFVVLNLQARNELSTLGIADSKIIYIPNGVVIPPNRYLEPEYKNNLKKLLRINYKNIVIFTGRLCEEKNIETLLSAWALLKKNNTSAHLILLGDGGKYRNIEGKLKQMASNFGLIKSVHFLGRVDNVFDYLLASDVFVLPSISEGMSNSLLEAASCGLGIVCADNDGNKQVIVNNENGILVSSKDSFGLFRAINNLIENKNEKIRLGNCAREAMKKKYSMEAVAKSYVDLFQKIIS